MKFSKVQGEFQDTTNYAFVVNDIGNAMCVCFDFENIFIIFVMMVIEEYSVDCAIAYGKKYPRTSSQMYE